MRGKGNNLIRPNAFTRITPAYAGKSMIHKPAEARLKDHPRLCGEKSQIPLKNSPIPGSPPPMRGKDQARSSTLATPWITPAYAGKSTPNRLQFLSNQDHPRLCGEKQCRQRGFRQNMGSPPPMRGKAFSSFANGINTGITPAYAGKRTFPFSSTFR